MLRVKPGVRVVGFRPEILLAIVCAEGFYREAGAECVITSVVDGKHSVASKHYSGCAVDLRTRNVPVEKLENLHSTIRAALGGDYDVVLERDHIHIEFDPKNPLS